MNLMFLEHPPLPLRFPEPRELHLIKEMIRVFGNPYTSCLQDLARFQTLTYLKGY